jgi:hypothetical protein
MSETHAGGGRQEQTRAGGIILAAISSLAAVLVIGALFYAAGTGGRHRAALAAAGCEPNLSPSGLQCTTVQMLSARYQRISVPAIQQLNADVAAYGASKWRHLRAARAALRAEVMSERALGQSLARFPFPPVVASSAKTLILADRTLSQLTAEQARSSSLSQLRSFDVRVRIATARVRADVRIVRQALAARPTASQEP